MGWNDFQHSKRIEFPARQRPLMDIDPIQSTLIKTLDLF